MVKNTLTRPSVSAFGDATPVRAMTDALSGSHKTSGLLGVEHPQSSPKAATTSGARIAFFLVQYLDYDERQKLLGLNETASATSERAAARPQSPIWLRKETGTIGRGR
jgi:hypothetical protein